MSKLRLFPVILLYGVALTGCGGGSGGESSRSFPTSPLVISEDNGRTVAETVVKTSEDITEGGSATNALLVGAKIESQEKNVLTGIRDLTLSLAKDRIADNYNPVVTGVSLTENCAGGGTLTLSVSDKNNNEQLDEGESVSMSFNNCSYEDVVLNGSMSLMINAVTGDVETGSGNWILSVTAEIDDFSASANGESYSMDGDFDLSASHDATLGVTEVDMQASNFIYTEGSEVARLSNFDYAGSVDSSIPAKYTISYDFIFASSSIGGVVTVITNTPFKGQGENPPDSGKLTLTGANNASVVVEAIGNGQATISIDASGDGDFDDPGDRIITGAWDSFFD